VREAEYSPPYNVEVKNMWSYTSTYLNAFMGWSLIKQGYVFMVRAGIAQSV
jgi:hypothetical protein